jgi:hypothetical protein
MTKVFVDSDVILDLLVGREYADNIDALLIRATTRFEGSEDSCIV